MTKEIWINLPVKDINRSKTFYKKLGFSLNTQHPKSNEMASFLVGEKEVVLMLFPEAAFREFASHAIPDPEKGTSVLFSIDAESPEGVNEIVRRAEEAGGTIYGDPGERDGLDVRRRFYRSGRPPLERPIHGYEQDATGVRFPDVKAYETL